MDSPGATQMANVVALFSPRRWYDLVPDQNHTLVTSGYGAFGQDDYVTAAQTPDGKLGMAYVPSSRTITVDLSTFSGPVTARWYDPTDGTLTSSEGSPFANEGSLDFATPGTNAVGDGDWVLVLETHYRLPATERNVAIFVFGIVVNAIFSAATIRAAAPQRARVGRLR